MKPHVFHPGADDEYVRTVEYYHHLAPDLGLRFHLEIERLIGEVGREPGRFFHFFPPAQRALTRKFPYALVFLDQPDRIWIVAVMHAKRRPGYWRGRLK